jgi:DNA-directed RNA polymerase specialized sigma24 family protein
MTTRFARAGARYYTRSDNKKLTFRNGKSFDDLAWEMKIDISSLSRILSGERLPTAAQLHAFCAVLNLTDAEHQVLEYAALRDYGARAGLDFDMSTTTPVINLLVRNVDHLRSAIDGEAFGLALDMLRALEQSRAEFSDSPVPPAPLLRVITMVQDERALLMHALSSSARNQAGRIEFAELAQAYDLAALLKTIELAEATRALAQLHFVEGWTPEEIAESKGLHVAMVHALLQSARAKLLQRLTGDPDEQAGGWSSSIG